MMERMKFPGPEHRKKYPSTCDLCGGTIIERRVNLPYPDGDGTVRLIEGAPAGVCDQCHEKYLTADTAREIDRLLAAPPSREETISVWEFAAGM